MASFHSSSVARRSARSSADQPGASAPIPMRRISSSVRPSRLPITTCWLHSYSARHSQPMRRIRISRSRAGNVFLPRMWFAKTIQRLASLGWFASVRKMFSAGIAPALPIGASASFTSSFHSSGGSARILGLCKRMCVSSNEGRRYTSSD